MAANKNVSVAMGRAVNHGISATLVRISRLPRLRSTDEMKFTADKPTCTRHRFLSSSFFASSPSLAGHLANGLPPPAFAFAMEVSVPTKGQNCSRPRLPRFRQIISQPRAVGTPRESRRGSPVGPPHECLVVATAFGFVLTRSRSMDV